MLTKHATVLRAQTSEVSGIGIATPALVSTAKFQYTNTLCRRFGRYDQCDRAAIVKALMQRAGLDMVLPLSWNRRASEILRSCREETGDQEGLRLQHPRRRCTFRQAIRQMDHQHRRWTYCEVEVPSPCAGVRSEKTLPRMGWLGQLQGRAPP